MLAFQVIYSLNFKLPRKRESKVLTEEILVLRSITDLCFVVVDFV